MKKFQHSAHPVLLIDNDNDNDNSLLNINVVIK